MVGNFCCEVIDEQYKYRTDRDCVPRQFYAAQSICYSYTSFNRACVYALSAAYAFSRVDGFLDIDFDSSGARFIAFTTTYTCLGVPFMAIGDAFDTIPRRAPYGHKKRHQKYGIIIPRIMSAPMIKAAVRLKLEKKSIILASAV